MKYLKHYESIEEQFKKYIVWNGEIALIILEKIKISYIMREVYLKRLYFYSENDFRKIYDQGKIDINFENLKEHTIYQSDNIEDCLDKLPMLLNSIKYNL